MTTALQECIKALEYLRDNILQGHVNAQPIIQNALSVAYAERDQESNAEKQEEMPVEEHAEEPEAEDEHPRSHTKHRGRPKKVHAHA